MQRGLAATATLACLALAAPVPPAGATFPGVNSKFALETCGVNPCGERGIWLTNANGVGIERLVRRGSSPAWSSSGRRVAFHDDRSGTSDIYVTGLGGDAPDRLTQSEANDVDPTWSPDGSSIAFTRRAGGASSLFVMDSDGTDVQPIANTQGAEDPAWSPVDDVIAFASPGLLSTDIKVVDLSSGLVDDVTGGEADDTGPNWSPNGQRIAFERRVSDANVEIFTVGSDGLDLSRVTNSGGNDTSPAWSPDGSRIAFASKRGDNPGVFTAAAGGGGTERVKTINARSIDWQACDDPADCPGGRVERIDTDLGLSFDKTDKRILTTGRIQPALPEESVKVSLFRRGSGDSFRRVASKRAGLDDSGRYETRFDRPQKGTCKLLTRFGGTDNYARSRAAKTFKCAIPLHMVAYSPEQLPSNTERALERIDGVKASAFWSGSKFMKFSRAKGEGYVDRPEGAHNIPLDVAFVQPGEFARFARPADRKKIRSLGGNEALMSEGEVGLRKGHERLRMRFTVSRARSIGAISNKSAQGYELILPLPAPRASVAFRTVLIEKPPGVSRKRISRKLRDLAGTKPMELRSEKEVPYLRHGMLVRPQLFVKKAFGEFSIRPTSGRSIDIGGGWVGNNIRTDGVPILGRVTCHRKIFPQLRRAMEELRKRGLAHTVTRSNYAGCFNPRFISSYTGSDVGPVKRLSRHAWGIALDINASTNPFGRPPRQDRRFVRIMKKWGFTWGGRWAIPDGMHFEWARFP